MKNLRIAALLLAVLLLLSSCGNTASQTPTTNPISVSTSPSPSPEPTPTPTPAPTPTLVPYDGVVEHIFFHPVVAYPELAFDGDNMSDGIDDWMVTKEEYWSILESLYANNYILVDINSVWSEYINDSGQARMKRNTLMLPEGKKPIIVSYDDVNYYDYMLKNGFTYKLIVGDDGEIWSWGLDPDGKEVVSQDLDAITLMDKFVREHPDFSLNGAKGCIGLTGFQGILGYRTQTDRDITDPVKLSAFEANRQKEIEAVKPVIAKLREEGWTFASHTWAHMDLEKRGLAKVTDDTERWLSEVGSLVGPTQVLLYPYGGRPDGGDVNQTGECFRYLQSKGFRIFASVGISSYSKIKSDICAVICDRLHPDGTTLRWSRDRYLHLYDAWKIIDLKARPDRPYDRNPGK